jgi:hypothetical protein
MMSVGMTVDEDETWLAGNRNVEGILASTKVQAGSRSLPTSQHEALRTEESSEIRCPLSVS